MSAGNGSVGTGPCVGSSVAGMFVGPNVGAMTTGSAVKVGSGTIVKVGGILVSVGHGVLVGFFGVDVGVEVDVGVGVDVSWTVAVGLGLIAVTVGRGLAGMITQQVESTQQAMITIATAITAYRARSLSHLPARLALLITISVSAFRSSIFYSSFSPLRLR